ncbi:MAG: hypothetical protein EOP24_32580 [Hyphomicrobiales bacterium]|nr:MAG: hypothetical protein EOP24_32580 [Hyphomicrobiales bacterium]
MAEPIVVADGSPLGQGEKGIREISQARWRLSPAQGRYGPGSALRLADSRARVVVTDIDGAGTKKTADLIVNGGGTAASPG